MVKEKMDQAALSPKAQSGANWLFWLGVALTAVVTIPFITISAVGVRTQTIQYETEQRITIEGLSEQIERLQTELENLK